MCQVVQNSTMWSFSIAEIINSIKNSNMSNWDKAILLVELNNILFDYEQEIRKMQVQYNEIVRVYSNRMIENSYNNQQ